MHISRTLALVLSSVALLSTGCLGFEKQTFVIIYNRDKDEVTALLLYEGFHVSGYGAEDFQRANKELEDLCDNKLFFAGSPLLPIRLGPKSYVSKDRKEQERIEAVLKQVTALKGTFFLDENKELCGSQVVTIRRVGEFTRAVNELIAGAVAEAIRQDRCGEQTKKLWETALKNKHQWFRHDKGRFTIDLPGSPEYLKSLDQFLLDRPPFSAFPLRKEWRKDRLLGEIRVMEDRPLRFVSVNKSSGGEPRNFTGPVEHARTLNLKLARDANAASVIADFLKKPAPKK